MECFPKCPTGFRFSVISIFLIKSFECTPIFSRIGSYRLIIAFAGKFWHQLHGIILVLRVLIESLHTSGKNLGCYWDLPDQVIQWCIKTDPWKTKQKNDIKCFHNAPKTSIIYSSLSIWPVHNIRMSTASCCFFPIRYNGPEAVCYPILHWPSIEGESALT